MEVSLRSENTSIENAAAATDDPPLFSSETQTELRGVRDAFRAESIDASAPFMVMDSPGAGGGYIGEFIIPLAQIGIPAVAGIVGAWLHGKFGLKALPSKNPPQVGRKQDEGEPTKTALAGTTDHVD